MADHADDDGDGDIFIYRGGRAPQHITRARIDESIDEIEEDAFKDCERLMYVDTHNGIRRIGRAAFHNCRSLRWIYLRSVIEFDYRAFYNCEKLLCVAFGDRLETIGEGAFSRCSLSLRHLELPSIVTIKKYAFGDCKRLKDVEFSERLETVETLAFYGCERLQRIAIPLKRDLFVFNQYVHRYDQFRDCEQLATVDLVGQAHTKTIASLHMESWRTEMIAEIDRINQVLPNTRSYEKANAIRQWMHSVIDKMDHYKAEHGRYVKEATTLLELALWKANLDENGGDNVEMKGVRTTRGSRKRARKEMCVTSGASIVIKNVLPFLQLE